MYRLLVVDDEAGHREGLLGLLCMLKPEYLVFEAENGERALQMMDVMSFDLVLTDIRMPAMDGLAFLSCAKKRQPRARFAILSAYGTFEYARQSIALGADEYLLKPVDIEELRACLDKMEGRLHNERMQEQEQAKIQSSLLDMQSNYREQQMYRFIMGDLPRREEEGIRQLFGKATSGMLIYMRPVRGWNSAQAREELRFCMRERLKLLGTSITFCPVTDYDAFVSVLSCERERIDEAKDALQALLDDFAVRGERLCAGICCVQDTFFERLGALLYHCARRACLRHFFEPKRHMIEADADTPYDPFGSVRLDVALRDVGMHIRRGDVKRASAVFEEPLRKLMHDESVYPSKLKEAVMYALMFLTANPDLQLDTKTREQVLTGADAAVMESGSFEEMLEGLRASLQALCALQPQAGAERMDPVDEAVRYVQEHFCEEISLTSVAQRFHYNPSYFSIQFKQRAGASFSDYLYELRMQHAAKLLKNTELYASEVGRQVGYPNAAYFTKAFKKRFGISPDQFRKRGGR